MGIQNHFPAGYTPAYRPGVRDTSRAAFADIKAKRPTMHDRIVSQMRGGLRWTRAELAAAMFMPTATMSARINELIKLGKVVEVGRAHCRITGKLVQEIGLA